MYWTYIRIKHIIRKCSLNKGTRFRVIMGSPLAWVGDFVYIHKHTSRYRTSNYKWGKNRHLRTVNYLTRKNTAELRYNKKRTLSQPKPALFRADMWLSRRSLPQKYVQIQNHQTKSRKSRVQPQKKRENKKKGNKNEWKTEAPTQNEQKNRLRTRSEFRPRIRLRAQSEKRGVRPPQKIYASFCEMKPIVLRIIISKTNRFWKRKKWGQW